MTPKEKVIPSAIKWMTKLAATMTHPQPYKEERLEHRVQQHILYSSLCHVWSNEPPSGAKLTSSSSSSTPCPVKSLSLALQEVAAAGKETNIIIDVYLYRFQLGIR